MPCSLFCASTFDPCLRPAVGGAAVAVQIDGDLQRTSNFIDGLRIPYIAPSLGGVESLVEQPTIISYW